MAQYGQHVAGDTIARLYRGVDRMHRAMQRYEPDEVLNWLSRMDGELDAFERRMSSMCDSALDTSPSTEYAPVFATVVTPQYMQGP